jgi:hypothetical protein
VDGGTLPYRWSADGALPAGLGLSRAGLISGVPARAGTAWFTARVTDASGHTAAKRLRIKVVGANARGRPDLDVSLTPQGQFRAGHAGTFDLAVGNAGTGHTRAGTIVTLRLPAGLAMMGSGHGTAWRCAGSRHGWLCSRDIVLARGRSAMITVPVRISAPAGKVLWAAATITAPPGQGRPSHTTANPVRIATH